MPIRQLLVRSLSTSTARWERHTAVGPHETIISTHLPSAYTYYKNHNDVPLQPPPPTARIYQAEAPPPHIPRSSIFHYLFPPKMKGKPPRYYLPPDPRNIAFIDGLTGRTLFRSDLPIQAMWARSGLKILGVRTGDVACIFGENSLEWVSACYAAQCTAMIVSPANYAYKAEELLHQLQDSDAKLVFVSPALLPTLLEALKLGSPSYTLPSNRIILLCQPSEKPPDSPYKCLEDLWSKAARPKQIMSDAERETAYLCYSSGTTGRPKGVETSHHNMTSQVQALASSYQELRNGDAILGVLPFGHIYGLTFLLHQPLTCQATVIILPRFNIPDVFRAIDKYKITWALMVPPMLVALVNSPHFDKYDLRTLKGVQMGAAPCPVSLMEAFENRFHKIKAPTDFGIEARMIPTCRVTEGYGLTETSPCSHVMTAEEGPHHRGSIGKIISTMQARLVDVNTGLDVQPGKPGELWLRGSSVMKGYWKNPEATKDVFAEGGWFKTGDLAIADKDGYFSIVDRVKELIKYKGFQVPPAEMETLLLSHPLIVDAGVIGLYSSVEATELPRAYIVPRGGIAALKPEDREPFTRSIARWVEKRVANHKCLRGGVILVDSIPKSSAGKILRRELRTRAVQKMEQTTGDTTNVTGEVGEKSNETISARL